MSKPSESNADGRAKLARPSLRLPAIVAALLGMAVVSPTAQADKPPVLAITKTNPSSFEKVPANDTTPLVMGHEGGEGTTAAISTRMGLRTPVTATSDPLNKVSIYDDPGCTGEPIGDGTFNDFEGTGIQVDVLPNLMTNLYVRQSNEASELSDCSETGFPYWESSTVVTRPGPTIPPVAPHLRTQPSGRANDNSPRILGSAPGADGVKIFANSGCTGTPIFNVFSGELDAGVTAKVPDNSLTNFTAISIANGQQSPCSPAVRYIEDSSPPHTRITMAPGAKTRRHKAVFRFADTGEDPLATSFQCRVNHKQWKPCHSPFKLRHLGFHRYVLRVRATDEVGNPESKPAKRGFKVVR